MCDERMARHGRRRSVVFPACFLVLAGIAGAVIAALRGLPAPAAASGVTAFTSATVLFVELCAKQGFRWYGPHWPVR